MPLEVADEPVGAPDTDQAERSVEIAAGGVTIRLPADTDAARIATVAAELAARR